MVLKMKSDENLLSYAHKRFEFTLKITLPTRIELFPSLPLK